MSALCGVISLGALAGCPNREVSQLLPDPDKEEFKNIPVNINRKIDILFVIDDSGSMREEQANLTANFGNFINVLQTIEGGLPDVHLGVVNSDVGALNTATANGCTGFGDNGNLQTTSRPFNMPSFECAMLGGNKFISDVSDGAGGRTTNYSGNLEDAFKCIAVVGTGGCGLEQHLESMKRALNGNGNNAGFLRSDAYLAVVFLADEDDCSASDPMFYAPGSVGSALGPIDSFRCFEFGVECDGDPRSVGTKTNCAPDLGSDLLFSPDTYVSFLKGLKDNPKDVIVATIIGNPDRVSVGRYDPDDTGPEPERPTLLPGCDYMPAGGGTSTAAPGIRLDYFRRQFPDRNTFTTICDDDLSDGLTVIAELLKEVIGNPCIEGQLSDADGDPANGIQWSCSVKDVYNEGEPGETEQTIPECDASASQKPCWRMVEDLASCPDTPTNLSIEIVREGADPDDTNVKVRCAVD